MDTSVNGLPASSAPPRSTRWLLRTLMRLGVVALGLIIAASAWDFFLFLDAIDKVAQRSSDVEPMRAYTDGVVVLTGGSDRLSAGVAILRQGGAGKLLISGVSWGKQPERHLATFEIPAVLQECCVTLGTAATDTWGNAYETRAWARRENLTSLKLVTATYHMPRSLAIFRAVMPSANLIPVPVTPQGLRYETWWHDGKTARVMLLEYGKYVVTRIRIVGSGFLKDLAQ